MSTKNLGAQDKQRAFWFLGHLTYLSAQSDKQIYIRDISDAFDFRDSTIRKIVKFLIKCGFAVYSGDMIEYDAIRNQRSERRAIAITDKGRRAVAEPILTGDKESDCFFPSHMQRFYSCILRTSPKRDNALGFASLGCPNMTRAPSITKIPTGNISQLKTGIDTLLELFKVTDNKLVSRAARRELEALSNELASQSLNAEDEESVKDRLVDFFKTHFGDYAKDVVKDVPKALIVKLILKFIFMGCLRLLGVPL
jgi:hypothetical protein